jgi:pimeloyl-ACP methyl ester carboxylesterase
MTLLHLATRYPERVSKLVLVGATSHFGEQARRIMRSVASDGLPPPVREQFLSCAARGPAQAEELTRQFGAFQGQSHGRDFHGSGLSEDQGRNAHCAWGSRRLLSNLNSRGNVWSNSAIAVVDRTGRRPLADCRRHRGSLCPDRGIIPFALGLSDGSDRWRLLMSAMGRKRTLG